jgi:hypothetical protein
LHNYDSPSLVEASATRLPRRLLFLSQFSHAAQDAPIHRVTLRRGSLELSVNFNNILPLRRRNLPTNTAQINSNQHHKVVIYIFNYNPKLAAPAAIVEH